MVKKVIVVLFTLVLLFGCEQSTAQQLIGKFNNNSIEDTNENTTDSTAENAAIRTSKMNDKVSDLSQLDVHYIDVGQADSTLFKYSYNGEDYAILYDAGDWNKNDVINYLKSENIQTIDLIIISHPHADHIGQLAEIIKMFDVDQVWFSGNNSSSKTFQKSVVAIMASDTDYYEPRRGETFEIGPLKIEVLHPKKITGNLNADSISVRFVYGDIKFLFTGDAYKKQELQMINSGLPVDANILHLGHHGSEKSSDETFLEAVDPDIAIYSAGKNNSHGYPHEKIVSLINQLNIDLYGTDSHSTIIITTDGVKYDISTKENGTLSPKNTLVDLENEGAVK